MKHLGGSEITIYTISVISEKTLNRLEPGLSNIMGVLVKVCNAEEVYKRLSFQMIHDMRICRRQTSQQSIH